MECGTAINVATIVLWNYFAILVNVAAFAVMYLKAKRSPSLKTFFLVHLSMFIWLLGKVFKTVSPTEELRWFFIVFYYAGICLLEVSFFDFAYIYYKNRPLKKTIRICVYVFGFLQFLVVATNPYHHLFYIVYGFWGDEFGPLFYVHVVFNYGFIIAGMVLTGKKFKIQLSDKTRFEKSLTSLAILVPLVLNFIYITRVLESLFSILSIQIFDITPIVYTWSILVFVYATYKYEFFDLTPIMKHEIVGKLDTPVLILNYNLAPLYSNEQFDNVFGYENDVIGKIDVYGGGEQTIEYENRFYKYYAGKHKSIGGTQFIVSFTDITAYEHARHALDKENGELDDANLKLENQIEMLRQSSRVGARNYIARELHDILGHSLVVTIKLLEVGKVFYGDNRRRARESLEKADDAIKKGFDEMKEITGRTSGRTYNTGALEREIRSMLKVVDISGVKVDFFMRGVGTAIDEKIYDTVKRIATELVTNTLKHSGASKLLLSITVDRQKIVLQTMDNGRGVKNFVKGNGLSGIDGRLALVCGEARYTAEENEGFSSNISIPL